MKEVIAVDLGGTYLRVALVKGNKILKFIRNNTPKTQKAIISMLDKNISNIITKRTKAIGISCAGSIENGIVTLSPNLPLKNFNLKKHCQSKFKVKTIVENDANCVALAELYFGVKKKNFFILTLGTGIGGGIIINKELFKGLGNGGELGHIILDDGKDFEYLMKKNRNKTDKFAKYIGQGISSLSVIFDPEVVVITGGMVSLNKGFLSKVKKYSQKYSYFPKSPKIVVSKLKHPGILGASLLIK